MILPRGKLVVIALALAALPGWAGADGQAGSPAAAELAVSGPVPSSMPLPANTDRIGRDDLERQKLSSRGSSTWFSIARTLVALGVVIGLILVVRVMAKRFGVAVVSGGRNQPMEVLARKSVGAKQQLLVVRFGRRVVLVGTGAAGMAAISETSDAQEVTEMLRSVGAASAASDAGRHIDRAAGQAGPAPADHNERSSEPRG